MRLKTVFERDGGCVCPNNLAEIINRNSAARRGSRRIVNGCVSLTIGDKTFRFALAIYVTSEYHPGIIYAVHKSPLQCLTGATVIGASSSKGIINRRVRPTIIGERVSSSGIINVLSNKLARIVDICNDRFDSYVRGIKKSEIARRMLNRDVNAIVVIKAMRRLIAWASRQVSAIDLARCVDTNWGRAQADRIFDGRVCWRHLSKHLCCSLGDPPHELEILDVVIPIVAFCSDNVKRICGAGNGVPSTKGVRHDGSVVATLIRILPVAVNVVVPKSTLQNIVARSAPQVVVT